MEYRGVFVKTIKISCTTVLLVLLLCLASTPVWAADQRVVDGAGLFTQEQIQHLEHRLEKVIEKTGADVSILTADGFNGLSVYDYIEEYYEQYGYGKVKDHGGAILVIDMQGRKVYVLSTGNLEEYYKGTVTDQIVDDVYIYLKDAEYYAGAEEFVNQTEKVVLKNEHPFLARFQVHNIMSSLLFGIVVSAVVVGIMLLIYRNRIPRAVAANTYFVQKDMVLTHRVDDFKDTYTSKRALPKEDSSSGGSGGYSGGSSNASGSSSSGRSFSGSSRDF